MHQHVFVVNPQAGGGRARAVWQRLLAAMPALAEARVVLEAEPQRAFNSLNRHLQQGARRVFACGGDGTVHGVANQLVASGRAADTPLGILPAGTGSDLARGLGLPRDPEQALRRQLGSPPRRLDAIEVRCGDRAARLALNVTSLGLSGEVAAEVAASPRRGQLSYLRSTLRGLWRYRPLEVAVRLDGEAFYRGPILLLAVANGRVFGKGMRVAPEALWDDGLADVVLIPPVPSWQLPWRLLQFMTGRHLHLPIVRYRRAQQIEIHPLPRTDQPAARGPDLVELDGEPQPLADLHMSLRRGILQTLA